MHDFSAWEELLRREYADVAFAYLSKSIYNYINTACYSEYININICRFQFDYGANMVFSKLDLML